ncbi:MAG: hypothetical protein FJ218_07740 [Ignavibacteria bacterium]|nr:hypothetical protein [Ignavibacteria bacterium]
MTRKNSKKHLSKNTTEIVEPVELKRRARVVGVVITGCPECNNPVNFDRKSVKTCPYCEAEVEIDLDRVEVMVKKVAERKPSRSKN